MLLLIAHIFSRWRDREAKVVEMGELLKKMFGRYLSTEVMNAMIEDPVAFELGGERRKVTIMMTDLRGFTAMSERLDPEQVVQLLNAYFEVMVEVILKFNGTINEIIGDALLVIFGAPKEMPDRSQQAIACAISMQQAMDRVNEENRNNGLPELEMGIGLNETEVIVGNIGTAKRSKYAVVGSGVNMASRIESYTVGGQILISESVRKEAGDILRIDSEREVLPKGAETPLKIYEVGGIAGEFNLALKDDTSMLALLSHKIPVHYRTLRGKDIGRKDMEGFIVSLSERASEIELYQELEPLTNLKMTLADAEDALTQKAFYGKVIACTDESTRKHKIRFTSTPPEVKSYFLALRRYATMDKMR
jgi:adenylate cyclase